MAEGFTPAQKVQERLKAVQKMLPEIVSQQGRGKKTVDSINKTHEKMKADEKLVPTGKAKLKALLPTALEEAREQQELIRAALEKLYEVREIRNERARQARLSANRDTIRRGALMKMLQTSAQTLPLFMPTDSNEEPPPLCGAVPADINHVAKAGDMVAALTRGQDGDNWILAEVMQYNSGSGTYEVEDIDEEQKEKLVLSRRRIIPLPVMRANPVTNPSALFPKDTIVMALYPQTTCFYKGVVKAPPVALTDEYDILFEDTSYPDGYSPSLKVAQRYVIAFRVPKKKAK